MFFFYVRSATSILTFISFQFPWANIRIEVSLAIVPHAHLIKVMETQAPSYRVEEFGIGHGNGDDLRDIKLEEVQVPQDRDIMGVAEEDEDEKGNGNEV